MYPKPCSRLDTGAITPSSERELLRLPSLDDHGLLQRSDYNKPTVDR